MTADPGPARGLPLRTRIGQVNQRLKGWEAVRWENGAARITDVLRREVDLWGGVGAIYGILRADPWSGVRWHDGIPPERSAEAFAAVQEHIASHGDGIPALFVEEAPHGLMALGGTTLPVNLALGAGMDAELTEELAALVAAEARSRGVHIALVSGLDVLRDPRWGRAEECFSEDPALAAMLVAATVRGMQGSGSSSGARIDTQHVAVVAKHLAAQGAGIGGRNGSGAPIGRRELGEIHLRPAFAAAAAGVAGFMAAYNDIDGVPCSANRELLTGTIREDWGWDGLVMADGTAIDRLRDSGPDPAAAAALALRAGVDLSLWDDAFQHIETALDRGLLAEEDLDRAVDRVLALKRRVGLIGDPAPDAVPVDRDVVALIEAAARQSVVLLENSGVLPLRVSSVAVVGPTGDDLAAQLGDYTPPRPEPDPEASTVATAFASRLGERNVIQVTGSRMRSAHEDAAELDRVRDAAARSDAVVVMLGGSSRRSYQDAFADNGAVDGPASDTTNGEGVDLESVAIPEPQLEVVRAARGAGRPVVGVVIDGRPRVLSVLRGLVDALVVVPFPGPRGGEAIVAALLDGTGGGRLPATFPVADGVMPVAHDERLETARGYVDHRVPRGVVLGAAHHADVTLSLRPQPQAITSAELDAGDHISLTIDVQNLGERDVSLPIPLYGRRHEVGIRPRRRTLLAVRRATVPAGTTAAVEIRVGLDELGSWATGRPIAQPVEVSAWCTGDDDQPADALVLRVTDENGMTPWDR